MSNISSASLAAMLLSGVLCMVLPVGVLIFWRRRSKPRLLPALWGAVTFLLFNSGEL